MPSKKPDEPDENTPPPDEDLEDFTLDLHTLAQCSQAFAAQQAQRQSKRTLSDIQHQDYIEVDFAQPVSPEDLKAYRKTFGLSELYSENYHRRKTFYKKRPLSNVQKNSFYFTKQQLFEQDNQVKLVFKSKSHGMLSDIQKHKLPIAQPFSFVLEIEVQDSNFDLYNKLTAINNLEAIAALQTELEIDDLET